MPQPWREMASHAGGSARGKASSRDCGCCLGEDENRGPQGEGEWLGSWAECAGPAANQDLLVARRAGAAAGTPSAAMASSLLKESRNAVTRDTEATTAQFILDAFVHTSALPTPRRRVPASEELLTLFMRAAAQCM